MNEFMQDSTHHRTIDKLRRMVMEEYNRIHQERIADMLERIYQEPSSSKEEHDIDMIFMVVETLPTEGIESYGEWNLDIGIAIRYKYIENPSEWEKKSMNLSLDLNRIYHSIVNGIRRSIGSIDSGAYMGVVNKLQDKIDKFLKMSDEHTKITGFDLCPYYKFKLNDNHDPEIRDIEDIPVKEGLCGFVQDCVIPDGEGPISRRKAYDDYRDYCNARTLSKVGSQSAFNGWFTHYVKEIHGINLTEGKGYGGNRNIRTWKGAGYRAEYERHAGN